MCVPLIIPAKTAWINLGPSNTDTEVVKSRRVYIAESLYMIVYI